MQNLNWSTYFGGYKDSAGETSAARFAVPTRHVLNKRAKIHEALRSGPTTRRELIELTNSDDSTVCVHISALRGMGITVHRSGDRYWI